VRLGPGTGWHRLQRQEVAAIRPIVPFLSRARHRALTSGAGALALAVACTGCGGKSEPAPSAQSVVDRAAAATKAEKHFHFVFDEEHGPRSVTGVHLVFAEGDVAVPGKVAADVSGTFVGLPLRSRLVVAGGRYYLQDPLSGKWRQVTVSTNPVAFFDPARGVLSVIRNATQLELAGSEKVGGKDAYHVKGKTTVGAIAPLLGNPPGDRLVDIELWVDEESGRLVRVRLAGAVEKGDPDDATRTIDLSRYGVVVPIVPPKSGT